MSADTEILRVMPREMRMMIERILSLTALPKGFAMMAGDVLMYSQLMQLGGFAMLERRFETLKNVDLSRISFHDETRRLDVGGQHAWIAVPSLLDFLGFGVIRDGKACIEVTNAVDPEELRITEGLGLRHGLAVSVDGQSVSATRADISDPMLDRVMTEGCPIPAPLWWRIYERAQTALLKDSAISRRHAGPVIVTEDGRVIGRTDNDDDTDISFIGSDGAASAQGRSA